MQTDERKRLWKEAIRGEGVVEPLNVETITVLKGYPVCRMSGSEFEKILFAPVWYIIPFPFVIEVFFQEVNGTLQNF